MARLAGMPAPVLHHARHALAALESGASESRAQVDLFAPPPDVVVHAPSAVEARLSEIDPDALSPREALDILYALKKLNP